MNDIPEIDFWKSLDDRMKFEVRFSASDDCTLSYIDYLDTKKSKESYEGP